VVEVLGRQGFNTWATSEDAERYVAHLLQRGAVGLVVVVYEIAEDQVGQLRELDLTQLSDEDVNAWLNKHSEYGDAEPHDWKYIVRNTGMGTEHYFASHVFTRLREVT
jgi:hypothetical protein